MKPTLEEEIPTFVGLRAEDENDRVAACVDSPEVILANRHLQAFETALKSIRKFPSIAGRSVLIAI